MNPIHSTPHSVSCNYTNPVWLHSKNLLFTQKPRLHGFGASFESRLHSLKMELNSDSSFLRALISTVVGLASVCQLNFLLFQPSSKYYVRRRQRQVKGILSCSHRMEKQERAMKTKRHFWRKDGRCAGWQKTLISKQDWIEQPIVSALPKLKPAYFDQRHLGVTTFAAQLSPKYINSVWRVNNDEEKWNTVLRIWLQQVKKEESGR